MISIMVFFSDMEESDELILNQGCPPFSWSLSASVVFAAVSSWKKDERRGKNPIGFFSLPVTQVYESTVDLPIDLLQTFCGLFSLIWPLGIHD